MRRQRQHLDGSRDKSTRLQPHDPVSSNSGLTARCAGCSSPPRTPAGPFCCISNQGLLRPSHNASCFSPTCTRVFMTPHVWVKMQMNAGLQL